MQAAASALTAPPPTTPAITVIVIHGAAEEPGNISGLRDLASMTVTVVVGAQRSDRSIYSGAASARRIEAHLRSIRRTTVRRPLRSVATRPASRMIARW